jgi:hypothetical protein
VISIASSLGACRGVSRQRGLVEEVWGVLGRGLQVEWVVGGEERADGVGDGTGVLVLLSHLHRGWDGSSR